MTRRFSLSLLFAALAITIGPVVAGQAPAPRAPGLYAVFSTTMGDFTVRLSEKDAPKTVENFVALAEGKKQWTDPKTGTKVSRPYYNGLTFHRIIPNFMIQGGDPLGNGTGGPGFNIQDEFKSSIKHTKPGVMSMANKGMPNSGGAQFFITVAPYPSLDGSYSAFGEVVEGMDVVMAISKVPTTPGGPNKDRPVKPVIMTSVKIERVPAA
jgi:peptidyl-prolyl cis-trans isomerase A (cyclophilin A)